MKVKRKIKIGVLGCANIALRSIIPAINELNDNFILSGISSRNVKKAKICAKRFNTNYYTSYKDLIDNADIEAIYIPLPNALHAEWIENSIKQGLHILVEKSLACSLEEVQKLNISAKNSNLSLLENFQFRFHSQMKVIHELLQNNAIGDLRSVRSSFGFPPFSDKNNIRYQKGLGGGALFDAGAYTIKISQLLLGYDLEVRAANLKIDSKYDVDIWGGAYLQQKNDSLFSELAFGFDNFYQCNVELWGSHGKIIAPRIFTAPPGFRAEIVFETNSGKEFIKVPDDNHFKNMLIHFYNLIIGKHDTEDEYRQNIDQARLIEELRNNAKIS